MRQFVALPLEFITRDLLQNPQRFCKHRLTLGLVKWIGLTLKSTACRIPRRVEIHIRKNIKKLCHLGELNPGRCLAGAKFAKRRGFDSLQVRSSFSRISDNTSITSDIKHGNLT